MDVKKVGWKATPGICEFHPTQQPHRTFCKIVEDDIVDARLEELRNSKCAVDKEGGAAADPDDLIQSHTDLSA